MKWFTASNEASLRNPKFFELLQVAVTSLRANTSLDPHVLYEGDECPALAWLRDQGVTIVPTRLTFYDALREFMLPNYREIHITCRAGAFLRTELAPSIRRFGILDPYVFYTDCDVLFASDIRLEHCRPKFFAASGKKVGGRTRLRIGGHYHINSGVMLINVEAMLDRYDEFKRFILGNGLGMKRPADPFMQKNLFMSDQVALNLFYRGKITRLGNEYNWNPSGGINPIAKVIHFNGLKWNQWDEFCNQTLGQELLDHYAGLVNRDRASYEHYANQAQSAYKQLS
ncbi:MAG: hypothetical protein ABGZ35_23435 [Planctomycetaceae bacterium]